MLDQNILLRNNVKIKGHGTKPMIFAPGFGCDQSVWDLVTDPFESDYKVILFDYVGIGKTDIAAYDRNKYSTLSGYAQDLLEVCSALDLKDAIFVGHSVSSMIGMLASLRHPEYFSHLIMLAPSPCYLNDPPDYYGGFEKEQLLGLLDMMDRNYIGWANMFAATLLNRADQPELAHELEDRFCTTDPLIARQFAEATFFSDSRADLPNVTIPSFIVQCSNDVIAPEIVGQYLHQHLPTSKLQTLKAIGHMPHMSDPEETIRVIAQYLNEESTQQGMM